MISTRLVKSGGEIEGILKEIPGAADVSADQVTGQPVLQDQVEAGRVGSTWRAGEGGLGCH